MRRAACGVRVRRAGEGGAAGAGGTRGVAGCDGRCCQNEAVTQQHPVAFDDPHDAPLADLDTLDRIRAALSAARYTVDGVERLLGAEAAAALHRDLLAPASIVLQRHGRRPSDATAVAAAAVVAAGSAAAESVAAGTSGPTEGAGRQASGDAGLVALVRCFLLAEQVEAAELPALHDLVSARLVRFVGGGSAAAAGEARAAQDAADVGAAAASTAAVSVTGTAAGVAARETSMTGAARDAAAASATGAADPREGELAEAIVDLRPYATDAGLDTWIAADLGGVQLAARGQEVGPLRRDHVVGIGPATTRLAQLTPREEVELALDLGVGMGVQTLHLLAHARRVIATDISARALAFARFNLLLAAPALGIDPARLEERVSLRLGSLLEPVQGERFDLVVSNPPFVITPRRSGEHAAEQYTYRDGGLPGDRIVETLVRGLGEQLAPGGIAIMLGNWEIHEGDTDWHSRLQQWPAPDVDLWVVQRERATPIEYADMWLRDAAENAELDAWRQAFESYLDDFRVRGVAAVGLGILVLRRQALDPQAVSPTAPLRRFEELGQPLAEVLAPAVEGTLQRLAWLRGLDGGGLANDAPAAGTVPSRSGETRQLVSQHPLWDETLLVAADVTEERYAPPGQADPSVILLRQGGGFRHAVPVSGELAGFVSVCDGELSAGQIRDALAELLEADAATLADGLLPGIRELVTVGILEPAWV